MSPLLHIIASCTERKRVPVPRELQLRSVQAPTLEQRAQRWWTRLQEHAHPPCPAQELYAGDAWRVALELPQVASRFGYTAHLWIASAGYGLIPSQALVRPYSATFTRSQSDSVLPQKPTQPAAPSLRQWWKSLASEAGPVPGAPRSLQQLAEHAPHARILVIASPHYIAALEEDLTRAAGSLQRPGQLLIISAPSPRAPGALSPHWIPSTAHHQAHLRLGGVLASLHVRVARDVLARGLELDAASVRGYYESLIDRSTPLVRAKRATMTDDDVRDFIARAMHTGTISCTAALRALRTSGRACEQQRFKRLFAEFQA